MTNVACAAFVILLCMMLCQSGLIKANAFTGATACMWACYFPLRTFPQRSDDADTAGAWELLILTCLGVVAADGAAPSVLPTLAGVAVGVAASVTRPLAAVVAAGTTSTLSLLEPPAAAVDLALAPLLSLAG